MEAQKNPLLDDEPVAYTVQQVVDVDAPRAQAQQSQQASAPTNPFTPVKAMIQYVP